VGCCIFSGGLVGDVDDGCCVCAGCSSAGSLGCLGEVFCEVLGFGVFLGVSECFGCDVRVFLEVGVVDVFFFEEVFVASADGYFAGSAASLVLVASAMSCPP